MSLLSSALVQSLMHVAEAQHLHASYQHLPQVKVPQHTCVLCACVSARVVDTKYGAFRVPYFGIQECQVSMLSYERILEAIFHDHSVRHFVFVFNASLYCIVLCDRLVIG